MVNRNDVGDKDSALEARRVKLAWSSPRRGHSGGWDMNFDRHLMFLTDESRLIDRSIRSPLYG